MDTPPTGTLTFLFTDVEGSTRLWEQYPEAMQDALAAHDRALRAAIAAHGGYVFSTAGDAFAAAFLRPGRAIAAAIEAQRTLSGNDWGHTEIRARMGIHTGDAEEREGDYFGPVLNRGARLMAAAHGRQIVVSAVTAQLVRRSLPAGVALRDLGEHRLKDLTDPEHLFQIDADGLRTQFPPLRTLDVLPNNLPAYLTPFVGREDEVHQLTALVPDNRLVTLTGAGGVGKTRLALQVAAELLEDHAGGVWFVDLSVVGSTELIPKQLAVALGIQEQANRPITDTLLDALVGRDALLIFDNCEHVIDEVASLVERVLRSAPLIRVLATSREALGIAGEFAWRVAGLALPTDPSDLATLTANESIRLFVDRAVRADRTFALTTKNAVACARICRGLDGLPLAIELAAARVGTLSPQQVAERLDDDLGLLTKGPRTAQARQQTLRGAIDWSYRLLSESEQALLRILSTFRGGFSLEAVEALWSPDAGHPALDVLTRLVDQSLVTLAARRPLRHFRLLETIRQYAWEQLQAAGETEEMLSRHRDYFVDWAETQGRLVSAPNQLEALEALEADHDNLRVVLQRSIASGDLEPALRVAAALSTFWWLHSHFGESGGWYERLLGARQQVPSRIRAKLLIGAGQFSMAVCDHEQADTRLQEALQIARQEESHRLEGWALAYLMSNEAWRLELEAAGRYAQESLEVFQNIGDPLGVGYVTFLQIGLDFGAKWRTGAVSREEAEGYLERLEVMLAAGRALGERNFLAHLLDLAGGLAVAAAEIEKGGEYLAEAVATFFVVGNQQCLAHAFDRVATLASDRGRYVEAAKVLGATDALRRHIGVEARLLEKIAFDGALETTRQSLPSQQFGKAWAEGAAMDGEQAAEYAREVTEAVRG
jgi:predicted ATPase/class 3 adenylate cyclase